MLEGPAWPASIGRYFFFYCRENAFYSLLCDVTLDTQMAFITVIISCREVLICVNYWCTSSCIALRLPKKEPSYMRQPVHYRQVEEM